MSSKEKKSAEEPTKKVKLKHAHEHERVQYQKDEILTVPASTAEYMVKEGIADLV
jgi:hypothetical protein